VSRGRMTSTQTIVTALFLSVTAGCASAADDGEAFTLPAVSPTAGLEAVAPSRLCVTDGAIDPARAPTLAVDVGAMRGVVAGDRDTTSAELAFEYPGPSSTEARLASGELRRQIGLKLRAQDTCNVVYVMWRVAPSTGIFVQVKHNPGQSTHEECADRGYREIAAASGVQPAPIQAGEHHTLRADIDGSVLTVLADGVVAWRGALPPEVAAQGGPVGVRSDNGRFGFELRIPGGARPGPACRRGQPAAG